MPQHKIASNELFLGIIPFIPPQLADYSEEECPNQGK